MILPDWAGYQRFRSSFEEITDPALYPIEWLDHQILRGLAWPIAGCKSALVVEVRTYPGGMKAAHGLIAAGDLDEIVNDLIPRAEQWGRDKGCAIGLIESRGGWARALKKNGYELHQVSVRKEL